MTALLRLPLHLAQLLLLAVGVMDNVFVGPFSSPLAFWGQKPYPNHRVRVVPFSFTEHVLPLDT